MIIYTLKDNTVIAEFDWHYKYTSPQAQWQMDILHILKGIIRGEIVKFVYPSVTKILNRKTTFNGKAKFDDVTTLEEAKEYAKQNLITKFEATVCECVNEVYRRVLEMKYDIENNFKMLGINYILRFGGI